MSEFEKFGGSGGVTCFGWEIWRDLVELERRFDLFRLYWMRERLGLDEFDGGGGRIKRVGDLKTAAEVEAEFISDGG